MPPVDNSSNEFTGVIEAVEPEGVMARTLRGFDTHPTTSSSDSCVE